MKIVISGGTGFIGSRIVTRLQQDGHTVGVYSRRPGQEKRAAVHSFYWDPLQTDPPVESLHNWDAVIHLAGEPVSQRWTPEIKQRIVDSRILGTRRLVDAIGKVRNPPKALISASAIGIYGDRGDEILTEDSKPGSGFLVDACLGWEAEADRAATHFGLRVAKLRVGFVLGTGGGALAQMLPIFKLGLGGNLGSGKQWMPWIHIDDVVESFIHAALHPVSGVWNAVSPNPVTNAEFTRELARACHRWTFLPVPPIALKILFGELAQHMFDSARVIPRPGLPNQYPDLRGALAQMIKS